MANILNVKRLSILFLSLLLLGLAGTINKSVKLPKVVASKQESAINFNSDVLKVFSAGQKRVIADLLWISTLIESDIEHYKKDDLNSWMYLRFKSLFELDPLFLSGYRFAGKYLSIVKDDLEGAEEIFEKGLSYYPNDYYLNFDAGFLYGFEMGKFQKAKERFEVALQSPKSPEYLKSLLVKFDFEVNKDPKIAFQLLQTIYSDLPEESYLKTRIESDLYALKAQIDLACLNERGVYCDYQDYLGNPYIERNGIFSSQIPYEKFQLRRNKKREQ